MLLRKKEGRKSKKGVFFSFFVPPFLLVCVFSLTKLKRRNDKNVLSEDGLAGGAFLLYLGWGLYPPTLTFMCFILCIQKKNVNLSALTLIIL